MGECLLIKTGGGIDTSDATALASTIISGYTAYVNNEKVTGSMVNRGSVTSSLDPGNSYAMLEGYYDGTGKISVTSLASNTSGTAQNAWILSGYNAWVNGNKLTGSMANRGNQSWSLAANGTQIIWSGFYDGTGKVNQSLTTNSGGTWTPTTSNKTLANVSTWVSGAWYVAGASTLIASNIKKGISIFGVTGTFVGYVSGEMVLYQNGTFYTQYSYEGEALVLNSTEMVIGPIFAERAEVKFRVPCSGNGDKADDSWGGRIKFWVNRIVEEDTDGMKIHYRAWWYNYDTSSGSFNIKGNNGTNWTNTISTANQYYFDVSTRGYNGCGVIISRYNSSYNRVAFAINKVVYYES